ncbi:ceramide-1-phosphate transfer protein [Oenanthe melanoleuca]|uniref:ceramide-1-phosphate transfer protein n=1 Tax=Oenanthe melanoleuca TaxID=2939378 RepID=UPI0024C16D9D|nr:ceramide-1-phosphate transfer protein [Oenanthe melanoleuca]
MAAPAAFSLREVLDAFRGCVTEQQEVLLEPYLSGWRGLIRFLQSLGAVFSFICKDAAAKVSLLEELRSRQGVRSVQALVRAELAAGRAALRAQPGSGCRTLLRLHRALRWLQLFLQGLLSGEPRTSVLCTDAYNASLAEHHPWLIRKAATVAFCALPSRDAFLSTMNVGTNQEAEAVLGEAIPYISQVYSITQELFERHQLLDLP